MSRTFPFLSLRFYDPLLQMSSLNDMNVLQFIQKTSILTVDSPVDTVVDMEGGEGVDSAVVLAEEADLVEQGKAERDVQRSVYILSRPI